MQICKETPRRVCNVANSAKCKVRGKRALVGRSNVANLHAELKLTRPASTLANSLAVVFCENPAIFSIEALKRGFLYHSFCYQIEQRKDNAILLSHIFQPSLHHAKLLISEIFCYQGEIGSFPANHKTFCLF